MKTKKKFNVLLIASTLMVLFSFNSNAQTFIQFDNQLPCDVEITIEDYGPPLFLGGPCSVCNSGPITLTPGITGYTLCGTAQEICITVLNVDGVAVNWYNHAHWGSTFGCHGTGNWINGQSGSSGTCIWAGGFNANGWFIN